MTTRNGCDLDIGNRIEVGGESGLTQLSRRSLVRADEDAGILMLHSTAVRHSTLSLKCGSPSGLLNRCARMQRAQRRDRSGSSSPDPRYVKPAVAVPGLPWRPHAGILKI